MDIEQNAFVLHSRPYRETSSLVSLFTPDYGKLTAVVRGVRGGKKAAAHKVAMLQPFQMLTIGWRHNPRATSDLITLQQLEATPLRFPLLGENAVCGLYENELLYRMLYPGVVSEALFVDYQQSLYHLANAQNRLDQAWSLRQFEFQLLDALGFGLVCDVDTQQQPLDPQSQYAYYPQMGAVKLMDSVTEPGQAVIIRGECLLKLPQLSLCPTCMNAWKALLRSALQAHLGAKPIMTRQLFSRAPTTY
ncbi:DNA repair protein RecO [Thiomicrorhabdus aquaedulcis]|uniref:DNA repair protein RecO n=1 Tax=Thiomicrorhabdus aquaedulcis TaxID=2211106 RepID=UPI000FDC7674|nr:DNA repair protein RecO [Thiomicrorhabdus aquaedulcis]